MRKLPQLCLDRTTVRPAVDFLRGFAMFTVVLMHLVQLFLPEVPTAVYRMFALGGTGAHVFILCSGFGLCFSQLQRPLAPGAFLRRRFVRVYLPYAAVILLSAALPCMAAGGDRLTAVLSHLLLFKMFVPAYMESFGVQFWFVSAIFGLYLLFLPLFALLKRLGRRRLFAAAMAVSLLWWILLAVTGLWQERVWSGFCLQFLWEFALGMVLAEYLHAGGTLRMPLFALIPAAAVGLSLQAGFALSENAFLRVFNDVPALVGYGAAALTLYRLCCGRGTRLFAAAAELSYGWYLLHMLVFTLIYTRIPALSPLRFAVAPAALAASLAAAWGFTRLRDGLAALAGRRRK